MRGHGADLTVEVHFAPQHGPLGKRHVVEGRQHRRHEREVHARLLNLHAAADLGINVDLTEVQAQAFFQYSQDKMQSVDVKSQPRTPGDRQVAARDQRLHFHGQRPLPVHGHNHRRPAEARVARAQKIGCGVLNDFQPLPDHLKDQQFLIRPETVLQHAQEPEHLAPVAFQRNDRIDHVLKQPRPGERAVLRDMAHQDHGRGAALAGVDDLRRHGPDLAHVAGQAFRAFRRKRLHGVHDKQIRRAVALKQRQYVLDPRCG